MLVRKAKVTSKGQVTIPQDVRKALKLRTGDTVVFKVERDEAHLVLDEVADPFAMWMGAWREGQGEDLETILRQEREARGR